MTHSFIKFKMILQIQYINFYEQVSRYEQPEASAPFEGEQQACAMTFFSFNTIWQLISTEFVAVGQAVANDDFPFLFHYFLLLYYSIVSWLHCHKL